MSQEDPWTWTAAQVIEELCGTPSLLERLNRRELVPGTKRILEAVICQRNIHGAELLGRKDIKEFLHGLGVFRSAEVIALTEAITYLRSQSQQYKRLHEYLKDQGAASSAAVTGPSNFGNGAVAPISNGVSPSVSGSGAPRRVPLQNNALLPAGAKDFGGAPMPQPETAIPVAQLESLLERYPEAEDDLVSVSDKSQLTDDVDIIGEESDEAVDDIEPREEDIQIPFEIAEIPKNRGRPYSEDKVVDMINKYIDDYTKTWKPGVAEAETLDEDADSVDEASYDAWILWHDFQRKPPAEQKYFIELSKENIQDYEAKVDKTIDAIKAQDWSSQAALWRQCHSLNGMLDNLYQEKWELDVYEMKYEPPNINGAKYRPLLVDEEQTRGTSLHYSAPQATTSFTPTRTTTHRPVMGAGASIGLQRQHVSSTNTSSTLSSPSRVLFQGEGDRIFLISSPQPLPTVGRRPSGALGSQREKPIVIDLGSDSESDDPGDATSGVAQPALPTPATTGNMSSTVNGLSDQFIPPLKNDMDTMVIDSIEDLTSPLTPTISQRLQRPAQSSTQPQTIPLRPSPESTRRIQLTGPPTRAPPATQPQHSHRSIFSPPQFQRTLDRRPSSTQPASKRPRRECPAPVLIPPSTAPAALTRNGSSKSQSKSRSAPTPIEDILNPSPPPPTINTNASADIASFRTISTWSWDELLHTSDRRRIIQKIIQEMQPEDREMLRERIDSVQKRNLMTEIAACVQAMARGDAYVESRVKVRPGREDDGAEKPTVSISGCLPKDVVKIERMTRLFISWWQGGDYYNAYYHAGRVGGPSGTAGTVENQANGASGTTPKKEATREQLTVLDTELKDGDGAADLSVFLDWVHWNMAHTFSEKALSRLWDPSDGEIIIIDD